MHIRAKLDQENLLRMVRWVRWHFPPDTGFEIQTLEVWGRARYLSVTKAPHNTEFYEWMGMKHFCFLQTAETGERTPNSSVYRLRQTPITPALAGSSLTIVKLRQSLSCDICGHYNRKRIMIGDLDPVKGQVVQTDMTPSWSESLSTLGAGHIWNCAIFQPWQNCPWNQH